MDEKNPENDNGSTNMDNKMIESEVGVAFVNNSDNTIDSFLLMSAREIDDYDDLVSCVDQSIEDKFTSSIFDKNETYKEENSLVLTENWTGIHFHALPSWMQDNDYILHENRPQLPSFAACFKSIFRLHSETGNIWSHLLGCFAVLVIAIWFLTRPNHEIQWEDKLVLLPFFFGAFACMGFSFLFHTIYCHSEPVNKIFLKLDYAGISLQFVGSFLPWIYYSFYCRPFYRLLYSSMILLFSSIAILVSTYDIFMTPAFRPYRVLTYSILGLWGIIPAIHLITLDGFWTVFLDYSLCWIILMALVYFFGAALYVFRIPERYFVGNCGIWFHSHQILHIAVVIATFIHYYGIRELAENRLSKACEEN